MFQIPADLAPYSRAGLADLRRIAYEEFSTIRAAITAAGADSAQISDLDRAEELHAFIAAADTRLAELDAKTARAAKISDLDLGTQEAVPAVTAAVEAVTEPADTAPVAVTAAVTVSEPITVADIAPDTMKGVKPAGPKNFQIKVGPQGDDTFSDMKAVTASFMAKASTYGTAVRGRSGDSAFNTIARIERQFDDALFYREGMGEEAVYNFGRHASDEKRLPGGSLINAQVAGVGWCAPSETIYTTCSPITASGLINLPEIGARRGGIRHNQGIDFASIFGGGTGYNILTEAQVIADTVKTCVSVPCPPFVDDRLKVAALCITGDLLQNVGYPEFVQTFIEGAIAAQAHNVNRDVIATLVAGSTPVDISTVDPWVSDNSVVSQVMSAAEMAVWDIRYRLRLDPGASIEMVFPYWVLAQMRADWIRRNAAFPADLTDAMIMEMFRLRGVVAQFVYDWQDSFSGLTTTGPGAATPLKALPSSPTVNLQFLAYPAGTWVLARQDVIRLDSVYDSTLLATNKVTQLFVEDGYLPMRMCPLSRVYTVNLCPNGSTGVQRAVTCTDVTP